MSVPLLLLLMGVVAAAVVYLSITVGLAFASARGARLVTCPETRAHAAVTLASFKAALSAPFVRREPRLDSCSRWPERAGCGQGCLMQIAEAPDGCLVRAMMERWYAGQGCAVCGRAFGELSLADHHPGLLSPAGETLQWHEVSPEKLPELFVSHRPVCWSCHVVCTVARKRPDLIVVRPPHPDPQSIGVTQSIGVRS